MQDAERLLAWIRETPEAMACLLAVRALELPDWAIGAGFVRSLAWDRLSGRDAATPLPDIDVLFFDPGDISPERERAAGRELERRLPGRGWSMCNQARMHLGNGDAPYRDTQDAVAHWLETPTAVAVRLLADGAITLLAPYGLADLMAMRVRPTPAGQRRIAAYRQRMAMKDWPAIWPGVVVEGLT